MAKKVTGSGKKRIRRPKDERIADLVTRFNLTPADEQTAGVLSGQHKKGVLLLAAALKGRETIAGEAEQIAKTKGVSVMLAKEYVKIKKILGEEAADKYLAANA